MPRYDYYCEKCGRVFECYASFEDRWQACPTGDGMAERVGVYREQFISCETGPRGGRKNDVPREEKSYRKEFKQFQEASQEMDYAYSRVDDPKVKAPNYYKEGLKQAKKRGAKIR